VVVLAASALLASGCEFPIGRSVEDRPLPVRMFGTGSRPVLLVGGLHTGREDNTRVLAEQMARYFEAHPEVVPTSIRLFILTSANPDGSAHNLHTNVHGVDLNRNWPADNWVADACHPYTGCKRGLGGAAPLSEPETAALYRLIETIRPEVTLVWHAHASIVEANEAAGADHYGRTFASAAGYRYIDEWAAYPITGQLIDALEQRLQLRAMDVELTRCCVITPDEFDRNLRAVLALLDEIERSRPVKRTPTPAGSPTPRPTPTMRVPDFKR
jgi:predicted deacylase